MIGQLWFVCCEIVGVRFWFWQLGFSITSLHGWHVLVGGLSLAVCYLLTPVTTSEMSTAIEFAVYSTGTLRMLCGVFGYYRFRGAAAPFLLPNSAPALKGPVI